MPSWWMLPMILLPVAGGIGAVQIPWKRRTKEIFLLAVVTLTSVLTALYIFRGDGKSLELFSLMDNLTLILRLDGAGKIFAGLLALLWPPATLYAFEYMKEEKAEGFLGFYTMSYGAALAIAFSGNLFTLYAFYECLTMVTLPLVAFKKDETARKAGRTYVAYSITGAAMAFVGLMFLNHYGTVTDFRLGGVLDLEKAAGHEELLRWVFLLAFIGFGTKAAVFPMHAWLPAVSVAPTPVTALLHAVAVVNAGTFAVIRMTHYSFGRDFLAGTVPQAAAVCLSCFTIVFASVMAIRQGNLKRRLAFSTVSNLAYMLFGAALMTDYGLEGSFLHLVCHSLMKIGLFWCAGLILVRTGRSEVQESRGLGRRMPAVCAAYTFAAVALTGVPPMCGFLSKWNLLTAAEQEGSWLGMLGMVALIISAVLTAVYILFPAFLMYFRPLEERPGDPEGKRWDKSPRAGLLLSVSCVMVLAAGLEGPRLEEIFRTVLGLR